MRRLSIASLLLLLLLAGCANPVDPPPQVLERGTSMALAGEARAVCLDSGPEASQARYAHLAPNTKVTVEADPAPLDDDEQPESAGPADRGVKVTVMTGEHLGSVVVVRRGSLQPLPPAPE